MSASHTSGWVDLRQVQRRVFTAEFKLESVRRSEARPAQGVSQAQSARELDHRVAKLRSLARALALAQHPDVPLDDVFPGHGRLPTGA